MERNTERKGVKDRGRESERERKSARAFFTQQNTQTLTARAGKIGNRGAIDVRKKETYQGRLGLGGWVWILQGLTEGPCGIGGFDAAEHGVKLKLLDNVADERPLAEAT